MKNLGIILLIVGILLTVYSTFSFFTKEKVVDIGKLEISKQEKHTVNWSPFVGIGLIVAGGIVLMQANKK